MSRLYEYRPTLFALAGILAGLSIDHPLGRISAGVLILMSIVIFNLRLNNRSR